MTTGSWAGVREQVLALAHAPGAREVFGYHGHGFRLAEPLTGAELAELEAQLGVRLPEEYRAFLREVGAGGAGPHYGLFPVVKEDGRWRWEGEAGLTDPARLAEPFPATPADPARVAALQEVRPDEEDFDDVEDFDTAWEAWDEQWGELMWHDDRTVGAVYLCELGCALRQWLVVSGPESGRIWSDYRADETDLAPLLDEAGRPVTFGSWYRDWLAAATAQAAVAPAGR
ncbi:SMI1/KNR4 family protein [Kitasatospora sp. NPDC004240]